jgi:hypothetical protein
MAATDHDERPRHAAQLRDRIDRGETGDKIPFPDPAAAPLGTDDEAAGTTPTPEQVRQAARHENRGKGEEPAVTAETPAPRGPGRGASSRAAPYSGDRARQGDIVLKARWQRVVFVGGLVLAVLLALVLAAA